MYENKVRKYMKIEGSFLALTSGRTFHTFCWEEIAGLPPKILERTTRKQLDGRQLLFEEYLLDLTSVFTLNFPRNRQLKTDRGKYLFDLSKNYSE